MTEGPLQTRTSAPADADRAYLLVFDGDTSRRFTLPSTGTVVIGRDADVELQLPSTSVSRRHARLDVTATGTWLSDLASHNGTIVNGERVATRVRLMRGDVVSLGEVTLVFHPGAEALSDAEAPFEILAVGDREIVVADPATSRTYALVRRLAAAELPVLVTGETGTGKDLVAAALHHWSPRAAATLVALNCAAVQENLVESELFGFAKGAFSGASATKPGLFETASGGTVLLDEVGELSATVQAKLLRVLETKRATRLGEVSEREVDIRIVAATNRDLDADVKTGRFRADLFYRLSAATVWLPPLRDRPRELRILAARFLSAAGRRGGKGPLRLSDPALRVLAAHAWPGHVRELKNAMDYVAATVVGTTVEEGHLPARVTGRAAPPDDPSPRLATPVFRPIEEELRELECRRMGEALAATQGHQPRAAALLGMPLRTFYTKAKQYGLRVKDR